MDTVGFMSDIPTGLIECFVATLEDAMLADLIIHVVDLSHENFVEQRKHVEETLLKLQNIDNDSKSIKEKDAPIANIIHVGNKIDCIKHMEPTVLAGLDLDCSVSSLTGEGLNNLLATVEEKILQLTNRLNIVIKVPMGGEEMQWLYKNAAVTESAADPKDSQRILLNCIISDASLNQFKHYFVK
jgi:50S ribosomal subunit-associated GTPase HflX